MNSQFPTETELYFQDRCCPAALFLGPKAENMDQFAEFATKIFDRLSEYRQVMMTGPEVENSITEADKHSKQFRNVASTLERELSALCDFLYSRTPNIASPNYVAHMYGDVSTPAVLGQLAAVFLNMNQVSYEAGASTTEIELSVCADICTMLGFEAGLRPWCHLNTGTFYKAYEYTDVVDLSLGTRIGGTLANIEALWTARNVCFDAAAVKQVASILLLSNKGGKITKAVEEFEVELVRGSARSRKRLQNLSGFELLSLHLDTIMELPHRLAKECYVDAAEVATLMKQESIQSLGVLDIWMKHFCSPNDTVNHPVVLVPGSAHYSWQKAAAIIGIGSAHIRKVPLDVHGRVDKKALQATIESCFQTKTPIMAVVVVCGTTEEGAVDPISDLVVLRESYRKQGFDFWIHVDGAYGGYLTAMIRQDWVMPPVSAVEGPLVTHAAYVPHSETVVSSHVYDQLKAIRDVDSITVDPHKLGFVQYAAGAVCYRTWEVRNLLTFDAPYIFHKREESSHSTKKSHHIQTNGHHPSHHSREAPNMGHFSAEGSRSGAMAAAVYLSHRVARPSFNGLGRVHERLIIGTKKLFAKLSLSAFDAGSKVKFVPYCLPSDKATLEAILQEDKKNKNARFRTELSLKEAGPDTNLLLFVLKPSEEATLQETNAFNAKLAAKLGVMHPGYDLSTMPIMVSTTNLDSAAYGEENIRAFAERVGLTSLQFPASVTVLRCVVMSIFFDQHGNLERYVSTLLRIANELANAI